MTDNNNKFVPQAPKTYEVRYVDLKEQSSLSKTVSKVASYLGMKTVENCSTPGCPCPNLSFDLKIEIEGNSRSWGRHSDSSSLPGYWEFASHLLGDYYWRRDLWLYQTDQGKYAIDMMNDKNLWTVNAAGLFCIENGKLCDDAKDFINNRIRYHESGNAIQEYATISSNVSKWSRYGFKTGAVVAAACTGNPAVAIGVGAAAFGVGQAGQAICDSNRGKSFWGTVSGMGLEGVSGGIGNLLPNPLDTSCSRVPDSKLISAVGAFGGSAGGDITQHIIHQTTGHYDPDCLLCKKS